MEARERIDDLQRNGFKIIQNSDLFCFGTDAVLLAHFSRIKKGDRIVDLGTGNGVIPLLLCSMYEDIKVTGVEIQPKNAELCRRNIELNGVGDRMSLIEGDIKDIRKYFTAGETQVVVTNPPYMRAEGSLKNESLEKRLARHEILIDLKGIAQAAAYLLKFGGRFFMVHKPERLKEIFKALEEEGIEPKRIRFVQAGAEKEPSMVLTEGIKGGRPGLRVMPAFVIYDEDGKPTEEYNKIYYGEG
ncbi:MAG: tRNA1(Val) (adenine(37)-N6)-methyltransferase [Clostridiales bacterium]|nr:tRNA1(Val) (adenine(37)-N6)-methyltransferase [Clostridiales bacterium]MCD8214166.1 tRNA1(Val) (adenine(37)-N6)-methyltransferase [Clostridiales bacterium]